MTQFTSAFGQIPLQVAAKPGVVVEDAEQNGIGPLAVGPQHAQGAVMKIQMPESVDVFALETADLPGLVATLGCLRSRTVNRSAAGALEQPVTFHIAPKRGVRRDGAGLRLLFHQHRQVVKMKLVTPTGMLPALLDQQVDELGVGDYRS